MKKYIIITLILLISTISCKKNTKQENYVITGEVTGFPDGTKLYLSNMSDIILDSTVVKNNKFQFKGHLKDSPEELFLETEVNKNVIFTDLLIGNENVNIKGDISDFPYNLVITGSKSHENWNTLRSLTKHLSYKRRCILRAYVKNNPKRKKELKTKTQKEISKIDSTITSIKTKYIKSHNNYTSIIYLGSIKRSIPRDTIKKIFNKYPKEIKESKYGKTIVVFLKNKILSIGDKYRDFEGLNKNDEKIKFSEIKGNKYTLLNFTNSSCTHCLRSASELSEIHKKYIDSVRIVSFSIDGNKKNWIHSLKREKVTWRSIWRGNGKINETDVNYTLYGLPYFFLINSEGIIIDKWSGYGKGSLIKVLKDKKVIK